MRMATTMIGGHPTVESLSIVRADVLAWHFYLDRVNRLIESSESNMIECQTFRRGGGMGHLHFFTGYSFAHWPSQLGWHCRHCATLGAFSRQDCQWTVRWFVDLLYTSMGFWPRINVKWRGQHRGQAVDIGTSDEFGHVASSFNKNATRNNKKIYHIEPCHRS